MAGSIIGRLVSGTNRVGLTAAGTFLAQHGFPIKLAIAMDFGNSSPPMTIATLLGLAAMVVGVVGIIRKEKVGHAITGIVTGGFVGIGPILLFVFLGLFDHFSLRR